MGVGDLGRWRIRTEAEGRDDDPAHDDWPDGPCDEKGSLKLQLPERLVRGLVALLAAPFLLLAILVIGCWLKASGKLTATLVRDKGDGRSL